MAEIILITGASSGFGRMSALALAGAGHVIYASMREAGGRNARVAEENRAPRSGRRSFEHRQS
jgi:NAD(P)-dependent dehydrogenase (short-subunit alcohol dehydrogenase family)